VTETHLRDAAMSLAGLGRPSLDAVFVSFTTYE
jgi:hypothetical protein